MKKNFIKLFIRIKAYVLVLMAFTIPLELYGQESVRIKGKIINDLNEIISGVTILEKGTVNGVISDAEGEYSISVSANATVVFSFIGYKSVEKTAQTLLTNPDIILTGQVTALDEIVFVGYSQQKKASLTGSVSSIKASELVVTKNENIANMLSGKVAGVRVIQSSGEPGTFATNLQIRGMGTPLYVIDGVPRNNMTRLDANEIESISVLKDASAAIYGVRASNGVVLITTKKGVTGKPTIEFSSYYGFQTPVNTPDGLDALQYMEITNENNIMRGSVAPGTLVFTEEMTERYRSGKRTGTDWWRINSNFYSPQYYFNSQITGGSDAANYFVNVSYMNQEGLYKSGDINYDRFNLRSNLNVKITKELRAEILVSGMMDTRNRPFVESSKFWEAAWTFSPVTPAYANYDRMYVQNVKQGFNPLVITNSEIVGYYRNRHKLFQGTGALIWDIPGIKGLEVRASYAYDYGLWDDKSLEKPYTLYDYNLEKDEYVPTLYSNAGAGNASAISRTARFGKNSLLQAAINYGNTFGRHTLGLLALYEEGTMDMDNLYAAGYINMTSIEELLGASSSSLTGGMNGSAYTLNSTNGLWKVTNKALAGRLNYNFSDRYYAEFAFRYDGSSKFAPGHQWGFFPSVSAAWRLSEEAFIKNNEVFSLLNNLKIRVSYGVSGDDITATFQFVPGYVYPGAGMGFNDGLPRETIRLRNTPNTNLTWYTSKMYNLGIDADFNKGIFGFEFDLFRRNRHGLLATRTGTIPDWIGESFAQENLNSDATQGFELVLKHHNRLNDFLYGISANINFSRHKRMFVTRVPSDNQYVNWRNNNSYRWSDIWWGYGSLGQFQDYDDIWSHAVYVNTESGNSVLKPGDYKYEDWNEDGVIDDKDVHPLMGGNYGEQSTPNLTYGMSLNAQYKGFDVNMTLQGGALGTIQYNWVLAQPFIQDMNGPDFFYDRWHMADPKADPKDPNTVWIPGTLPVTSQGSVAMGFNAAASESSIHKAGYVRCKTFEVGYTIPQKWIKKSKIGQFRIFCNAYNLFTITQLKYLDPEHPSSNYGLTYPLVRTINFGLSVKL
jgi:TonB-linked SusC/RagA family outer membrane protein